MSGKQKDVLLSVIVPTYNVEKYLEKCITSLATYLPNHAEILIIDDGSTDSSGVIAEEMKKSYSNVEVFHKENGGLSDARNFGIKQANGKYMMFVDSDDYVDNSIAEIFKYLDKNVDVVFVGFTIESLKKSRKINYAAEGLIEGNENIVKNALAIRTIKNSAYLKVVKKDFILENNLFFNNGFSEDFEWTGRLFCYVSSAILTNLNYYHYIAQREGSIMNTFSKNKFHDIINHAESITNEIERVCSNKLVAKKIKQYVGFNIVSIFRNIKHCHTKQDKLEVEKLMKDNIKYIKHQKSLLMKLFVLGGRIFGFRFMYKFV